MTGAALATILGQITTAVLCLSYIPKLQHFKLSKSDLRIRSDICKSILSLGLPSFAMHISNTATQIIMNNLMRTYGGASIYGSTIPLSCYGTLMKLYQIAHSMFVGVCSGTQPINGFNFGAKKYSRVIKTYKYAISSWNPDTSSAGSCTKFCEILCQVLPHDLTLPVKRLNIYF